MLRFLIKIYFIIVYNFAETWLEHLHLNILYLCLNVRIESYIHIYVHAY